MNAALPEVEPKPRPRGRLRVGLAFALLLGGCGADVAPPGEIGPAAVPSVQPTHAPRQAPAEAPHVVLITIDTFRADRVERDESLTPNIDRLAQQGTVFERAVTPIGTTMPALASALTGLHPREHGVQWNGGSLRPQFTTLAEVFQQNGYATGAFVSFFDVVHGGGMGQGFDARVEVPVQKLVNLSAEEVNRQALAWLRRPRNEPILFWVHYLEPHSPYRMTPYAQQRLPGLTGIYRDGASVEEFYRFNDQGANKSEDREILNILYDGEVVEVDRAVGEILDAVEELDSARPTVVVLTADHGQLLGEHDRVGHGNSIWEEVLHIPMIVRDTRREDGRRVSTRVGLVDLFPTLLELAGLEAPSRVSGRSFASALDGLPLPERHYYAETHLPPPPPLQTAVLYGDRKIQKFRGNVSAFDLGADPKEHDRTNPSQQDRELVNRLDAFGRRQGTSANEDPSLDELEKGRNARLIALGYAVETHETELPPKLDPQEAVELIQTYGEFLSQTPLGEEVFDDSRLPHAKSRIKAALLQTLDALEAPRARDFLTSALLSLSFFQPGVGDQPLPLDTTSPAGQTWREIVEAEVKDTTATLDWHSR